MYQNEREQEIQKLLAAEGYMTVRQLAQLLYTSESSIRRDLNALEKRGVVKRSYGGVELERRGVRIPSFGSRVHTHIQEKKSIAEKAAQLVKDGDIVFLDQSSSALFVARAILDRARVTVVTNNIEILTLLAQSDLEVISSGGSLSRNNRNCLLGHDAHAVFERMRADFVFFSARALTADGMICDCDREEVCVRETMLRHAAVRVFLCAGEKIGRSSGYRQCTLDDVDYMITEAPLLPSCPLDGQYREKIL